MSDPIRHVIDYHEKTKHSFDGYAPGPGRLDWATQPDPFRRYEGARLIALEKTALADDPSYDAAFLPGQIPPAPLDAHSISRLFFDSLSISAWKSAGGEAWALRVDPSSGNLHPTEGYLICGPVEGLCTSPMVCHYAPKEHALEIRAEFPAAAWEAMTRDFPEGTVFVGVASIHWREAWKYGERAYRYCQLDAGHVLAALGVAAAGLGWQARILDDLSAEQLALLLGLRDAPDAEPETPDLLLAVCPQGEAIAACGLEEEVVSGFAGLSWNGQPNRLSPSQVHWPLMAEAAGVARKPLTDHPYEPYRNTGSPPPMEDRSFSLRRIIRQRRSAQAMDGVTSIRRAAFYRMLLRTLPRFGQFPYTLLPWPPKVHLALFVHRVDDLPPGLYFLVRDPREKAHLQEAMRSEFIWKKPDECPKALELYLLEVGDARRAAEMISCTQSIASDGCFSLGMIARFGGPLERYGPWFYPRLYWECGMLGQALYLEAEAAGVRGTGIGCFFDDPMHEILGLQGHEYQDLYHFTIGGPVEDTRITTLPAYPGM